MKDVLKNALRDALRLGHTYIGTEHLLLGLSRDDGGAAMQILADAGIDAGRVRDAVMDVLSEYATDQPPTAERALRWRLRKQVTQAPSQPPRPRPRPTAAESFRNHTAAARGIADTAAGHAAGDLVATTHYLRALLDDPDSAAAKVLESFGVTPEAVDLRIAEIGVDGTTDEQPAYTTHVFGGGLTIRIEDPDLAERVRKGQAVVTFNIPGDTDPAMPSSPPTPSSPAATNEPDNGGDEAGTGT